jgi:hypothetical protein
MTRTIAALTIAAQLLGTAAIAQTATTTEPTGTGMAAAYGRDWSASLGSAMFGEDGSTLRSATEISTQWNTLSDADKELIRRDCMVHMQTQGASGSTAAGTEATGTSTDTTTGETAQAGTASSTETGQTATGDATAAAGTDATGSTPMMNVTMEQMDQICAATKDL